MRRRKFIAMVLISVPVIGAILYLLPPREPVYAGEPLSYWLEGYDPIEGSEPGRQKADEIMREAGTNAIPTLLRMLREHDSPWKLKLIKLAQKQHVVPIRHVEAWRRNLQAMSAFETLGSDGKVAMPELMKIYEMNLSPWSQEFVMVIFASIGPPARQSIPILLRALASNNAGVRPAALQALGRIHAEPRTVVPALMGFLHDRDPDTHKSAARALGEFGPDAKEAVQELIGAAKGQDQLISRDAREALQKIDPETAAKVNWENDPGGEDLR